MGIRAIQAKEVRDRSLEERDALMRHLDKLDTENLREEIVIEMTKRAEAEGKPLIMEASRVSATLFGTYRSDRVTRTVRWLAKNHPQVDVYRTGRGSLASEYRFFTPELLTREKTRIEKMKRDFHHAKVISGMLKDSGIRSGHSGSFISIHVEDFELLTEYLGESWAGALTSFEADKDED